MIKKQLLLFIIAAVSLAFTSCVSEDKVKMLGVEDFTMVDEDRLEVTVRIENVNGSNLTIKNAYIALVENNTELVKLSLAEKVVIPRRSSQGLLFPVIMQMNNPETLSTLPEKSNGERSLTVQGKVTGKVGIFSKSYKIGPMSVDEFLAMLDESNRELVRGFIY